MVETLIRGDDGDWDDSFRRMNDQHAFTKGVESHGFVPVDVSPNPRRGRVFPPMGRIALNREMPFIGN